MKQVILATLMVISVGTAPIMSTEPHQKRDIKLKAIEEKHYYRENVEQKSLALISKEVGVAPTESAEENHIPVGTREVSHADFVEHQEKRALSTEVQEQEKLGNEVSVDELEVQSKDLRDEGLIAKKVFYTSHEGAFHRAVGVTFFGDQVTLEDGSIWTVASFDRWNTLNWLTTDTILVMQNKWMFSSYKFMLVNQNTGAEVEVNLTLGPIYSGVYTHWIVAIDYFNDEVFLEDGSIWKMDWFDSSAINKWMVNDTVIVGVNESRSLVNPNILINVNVLNYARGICLN